MATFKSLVFAAVLAAAVTGNKHMTGDAHTEGQGSGIRPSAKFLEATLSCATTLCFKEVGECVAIPACAATVLADELPLAGSTLATCTTATPYLTCLCTAMENCPTAAPTASNGYTYLSKGSNYCSGNRTAFSGSFSTLQSCKDACSAKPECHTLNYEYIADAVTAVLGMLAAVDAKNGADIIAAVDTLSAQDAAALLAALAQPELVGNSFACYWCPSSGWSSSSSTSNGVMYERSGEPTGNGGNLSTTAHSGNGNAGTPCTDACDNTKEGIPLFCVTDEYLATESDGSKFCSCQNRNFRITKGEPDYDTSAGEVAQAKAAFESAKCTAELVQLSVAANLSSNCETLQNDVDAAEVAVLAGPNRRKETRTVVITLSALLFLGLLLGFVFGTDSDTDCGVSFFFPTGDWGIALFFCCCSIVIGILGLSFARYGLLKASSITTYSPAHGCLPYNYIDVAAASAAFEAEEETPDASADFEYGYADGWSGTGIYWCIVHLCTPLLVILVFARPGGFDSSDWIPFSRPFSDWEGMSVTYLLVTIAFAFEMSAIIVVSARAQGHSSLIGYGVFFMIGVSLALCFPVFVHYFYTYETSDSDEFRSERGAASKVGLFIAATLSLLAVVGIAITTTPAYISAVTGTGESGSGLELSGSGLELEFEEQLLEFEEQLQAVNKENESKALTTFAIIGSIVTAGLLAHYGAHPLTRDYELYLLVWGGLLDATTDVLYMMMEVFYDEAIFSACASIILLPLIMVALSFWPLMAHEYKTQNWRYIFLPFEGAMLLLVLPFISSANIVPAFSAYVFSFGYKIAKTIFDKMYVEITEKRTERRGDDGEQRHFKKKLKFYHRGVFEALLAFVLAPVAILIIAAVGLTATAVGTAIMFIFVLAGPIAIALVFSIMAFLRLFVLFPTVWEELYYFSCWFARMARKRVPVDDFMDDDRLDTAKGQVFKLYKASSAKSAKSDMKNSTIKYLFVEFLLEALPQLIIQGINNNQTNNWSNISIISMTISGIIILNSVIKYGSLCLVDEEEVFGGFA